MARSSYYLVTPDTMLTCYPIYKCNNGLVQFHRLIKVKSKNQNRPASIESVPKDTLRKYKLKIPGEPIPFENKIIIQDSILDIQWLTILNQGPIQYYTIEYEILINSNCFYKYKTIGTYDEIQSQLKPKIKRLYYAKKIKAYYIVFTTEEKHYIPESQKIGTIISWQRATYQ